VNTDYDDSKVTILIWRTKNIQLNKKVRRYRIAGIENSAWMLKKITETLNVAKSIVSNRLHAMGKIQKEDQYVPHELSELAIQNCLSICFLITQRNSFCIKF